MNATFTGVFVATRGLYASQAGISVANDNASNANATGYSRQTITQTAYNPAAVYSGKAVLGNGTEVTGVEQERDFRLDQRYWQENTLLGEWETKSTSLKEMESILDNSSNTSGFSTLFDKFSSDLDSLKNDPSSSSERITLRQDGEALCQYLNETSERLTEIRDDQNNAVKSTVDQINSDAEQIAKLNQQISEASAIGTNVNSLKDQRTVLIDKLSKLTDCTVEIQTGESENQRLSIRINGIALVDGEKYQQLSVVQDNANNNMYNVQWQQTGEKLDITGGALKAEVDLRDGDGLNGNANGVPYFINQLDKFAQTFAKAFNEGVLAGQTKATASYKGHADGYTQNDTTGIRFFSYSNTSSSDIAASISANGLDNTYNKITAANISLTSDVETDVKNIATTDTKGETENSNIVQNFISMLKDSQLFNKGTPGDFYNSIVTTLATNSSTAQRRDSNFSNMVKNLSDRRTSISGVDTNEETANAAKYQQAYAASGKMIDVWNKLYQTTIAMVND